VRGQVIQLDRSYPLVRLESGQVLRTQHATAWEKMQDTRAVVGDWVEVAEASDTDTAIIEEIYPREHVLVRRDPAERSIAQVLAANFDLVFVAHPAHELNIRRLERELVLACSTGCPACVLLTKTDLAGEEVVETLELVQAFAGDDAQVLLVSDDDAASVSAVHELLLPDKLAVLIGRSGVGKSTLVNLLAGDEVQAVSEVRETDGKGRHTTVNRAIVFLEGGGALIDMPGVRGLGMWDSEEGILKAFHDVAAFAQNCKFRDCSHDSEPGCAVRAAVEAGELHPERVESFRRLMQENSDQARRSEQSHWKN